jgi:phosphonopyruvate decarboxylase
MELNKKINTDLFITNIIKKGIKNFVGVPDSVLKNFTNSIDKLSNLNHEICANEGIAIGYAIGNYLKNKKPACVYMQNSGFGNAFNPIVSLLNDKVYQIPIILIIGWRGSDGKNDEEQHLLQGKITKQMLKLLQIKFCEFNQNSDFKKINSLLKYSKSKKKVVAILVKKDSLEKSRKIKDTKNKNYIKNSYLESFEAQKIILESFSKKNSKIICSTGYNSRELLYLRQTLTNLPGKDLYIVGGMGHTSSIALGASDKIKKTNSIICIDGDGSLVMHLGSMINFSKNKDNKLMYFLLNNNVHESVGGQNTNIELLNLKIFCKALKIPYFRISNKKDFIKKSKEIKKIKGTSFIEIKTKMRNNNLKANLPRPKNFKKILQKFLND